MTNIIIILLQLSCWFLLTFFGRVIKKNNEQQARDSLTSMPSKFIAIENTKATGMSCNEKEKRKAEIKKSTDSIAKIDRLSKKLCNTITCIGLFCIASSFALQLKNMDFKTGFLQSNVTFIVYWYTLISAVLAGVMCVFENLLVAAARKESRIMQAI